MSFPSSPTVGQQATVGGRLYQWSSVNTWDLVGNVVGHAATHATGGSDAITPASIGAAATSHTHSADAVTSGTLSDSRLSANVVLTGDARLADSRNPTSHASSHAAAGSDPLTITAAQVTDFSSAVAAASSAASPDFIHPFLLMGG